MSESTLDELQGHHKAELVSYKPSWFDRLQENVDRLPGQSWLIYALFGILLLGIDILISWTESSGGELVIDPISILIIFQITYILIFLNYLDKQAVKALKSLRPSLSVNSTLFERLKYKISTLPARQTLLISIFSLVLASGLILMDQLQPEAESSDISFTSASVGIYTMVVFGMVWMMNAIFLYHTVRQLRTINHIYTKHTNINLFHQRDLYAFSGFSAQTAIGLVLPGLPWIWLDPGAGSLLIAMIFAILGIIAFISPLLGVHNLLNEKKQHLLDESSKQIENAITTMFSQIEVEGLDSISGNDRTLTTLEKAHDTIDKVSTWPWQAETLRRVLAALSLPLAIWLIQHFLGQWLPS